MSQESSHRLAGSSAQSLSQGASNSFLGYRIILYSHMGVGRIQLFSVKELSSHFSDGCQLKAALGSKSLVAIPCQGPSQTLS